MAGRALTFILLARKGFRSNLLLLPAARSPAARVIFPGAERPVLRGRSSWMNVRFASSGGSDGEEKEEGGEKEGESDGEDGGSFEALIPAVAKHHAITQVTIPDNFPEIPVLPVSRNPIFPRFVRMLEVRAQMNPHRFAALNCHC